MSETAASPCTPAPTPALKDQDGPNKRDQNDSCELHVKPEFVKDHRPSSLGDLPPDLATDTDDDRSKRGNKKKNKKKRPRDVRTPNSEKVCLAVIRGDPCPWGDTCKFSHDLPLFMKTRPEDLTSLPEGCPNFCEQGHCLFGALCRFGFSHIRKETGENMTKDPPAADAAAETVKNNLPKEVILKLRKREYPFQTKRHESKGKNTSRDTLLPQRVGEEKDVSQENGTSQAKTDTNIVAAANEAKLVDKDAAEHGEESKTSNETPAAKHFKDMADPFRPSLDSSKLVGNNYNDSTSLPSKTKKLIDFSGKVYVAPLTTVGNLPFRRVLKGYGADITCGEMAMAGNLLDGKPSEWALLKRHSSEDVFGVQIASGYPDQFARVCEVIENHMEVDFVDLNLGCPLDVICNKGAGSSLMLRDRKLKSILQEITPILSCPVTIKMRTGWDVKKPFAHELVSKIQSWGIDGLAAVMVHGRSRLQRYSNLADWDYIAKVAQTQSDDMPKLPLIGNGDIFSYTDYEEKVKREGISATAMLARGALVKPWLPTEIKERRHWDISASERLDMLKDFVRFGLLHWGSDQQGVDNTRRFLLEWLSFLCRYVPVGLLETSAIPQQMNQRPPLFMEGRTDLETLMLSPHSHDWIKISEMLLGKVPEGFQFEPKHKAKSHT